MRVPVLGLSVGQLKRVLVFFALQGFVRRGRKLFAPRLSSAQRRAAIAELRRLVEVPSPRELGGERVDTATLCRFLSVVSWDASRGAEMLKRDLTWRRKYKPRALMPADMPIMCRQHAWHVLMRPVGGRGALNSLLTSPTSATSALEGALTSRWRHSNTREPKSSERVGTRRWSMRAPLHPPHHRPPLQQWRYTRSGMPVTCFVCREWRPDKASRDERARHVAYHVRASTRKPYPQTSRPRPLRRHANLAAQALAPACDACQGFYHTCTTRNQGAIPQRSSDIPLVIAQPPRLASGALRNREVSSFGLPFADGALHPAHARTRMWYTARAALLHHNGHGWLQDEYAAVRS